MRISKKDKRKIYHPCTLPVSARAFFIKVNSISEEGIKGEIRHLFFEKEVCFYGLDDAILKMDSMMDQLDCPQASTILRDFNGEYEKLKKGQGKEEQSDKKELPEIQQYWDEENFQSVRPGMPCYLISVMFRQNSSWQGEISWWKPKEQAKTVHFRSVLELMHLIWSSIETKRV